MLIYLLEVKLAFRLKSLDQTPKGLDYKSQA
jgi:hypothetical protein